MNDCFHLMKDHFTAPLMFRFYSQSNVFGKHCINRSHSFRQGSTERAKKQMSILQAYLHIKIISSTPSLRLIYEYVSKQQMQEAYAQTSSFKSAYTLYLIYKAAFYWA